MRFVPEADIGADDPVDTRHPSRALHSSHRKSESDSQYHGLRAAARWPVKPRELTSAIVRFIGAGLDTEVRVPLTEGARAWYQSWYQSETSSRFGSQFALTLPFTVQGSSNAIRSATLTVTNAEGASQDLTVEFGSP